MPLLQNVKVCCDFQKKSSGQKCLWIKIRGSLVVENQLVIKCCAVEKHQNYLSLPNDALWSQVQWDINRCQVEIITWPQACFRVCRKIWQIAGKLLLRLGTCENNWLWDNYNVSQQVQCTMIIVAVSVLTDFVTKLPTFPAHHKRKRIWCHLSVPRWGWLWWNLWQQVSFLVCPTKTEGNKSFASCVCLSVMI